MERLTRNLFQVVIIEQIVIQSSIITCVFQECSLFYFANILLC